MWLNPVQPMGSTSDYGTCESIADNIDRVFAKYYNLTEEKLSLECDHCLTCHYSGT